MKVVSNTSPLINLSRIGRLDLLKSLFGELWIPRAVWQEVVVQGEGMMGAAWVRDASWIRTFDIQNQPLSLALQQQLDSGESEAIALALETHADVLLMDERLGRETAQHLGIRCVGLMGILLATKRQGIIDAGRPLLEALRNTAGFRIGPALYQQVLHDLGES